MKLTAIRVGVTAAVGGVGIGISPAAWSQAGASSSGGLEEVIVTATRRAVSVQDLPLAITALTADTMTMNNIENMEDLKGIVPNVLVNGSLGGTTNASFTMRGIPNVGTYVDGIWQVSSNGLLQRQFVELERVEVLRGPQGTLYGRDSTGGSIHLYTRRPADEFGAQIDLGLGSYDRQDVNATVDIPITDNFKTRFTVGSYDHGGFLTSVTTGLKLGGIENDVLRMDLNWSPSDRVDIRLIRQEDELTQYQARIQNFIADPVRDRVAQQQGFQVGVAEAIDIASGGQYNCVTQCSGFPGGVLGEYETTTESTTPSRQELDQTTFSIDVDITDSVHFKYLYGDTEVDSRQYNDWDATQFNLFVNYNPSRTEMDSHELQFSGGGDRISWVGGFYTWDQTTRQRTTEWASTDWSFFNAGTGQPLTLDYADVLASPACTTRAPADFGLDFGGDPTDPASWPLPCGGGPFGLGWVGIFGVDAGDDLTQSIVDGEAYFGEVTFSVTDRLDITLGYRQHDQSGSDGAVDLAAAVAAGLAEARPVVIDTEYAPGDFVFGYAAAVDPASVLAASFDESTYRFAAQYQFTDNILGYVGYSEGFNSGGVDSITDSVGRVVASYPPEFIENTEIGIRSDLLNGRLRFNATYFDTNWKNIQLAATWTDRGTGGEATELLTQAAADAVADGIELEFNYAVTDSLLVDATFGFLNTEYTRSISPGLPVNTSFAQAPDNTYNFGITYDASLSNGGSLITRVNATYWDVYWRSQNPALRQDRWITRRTSSDEGGDIWNVNARLAYRPPEGNYEVALWGTNLLDEYNRNSGFMHGVWQFDFATIDRPREVGVGLRMFFE